MKPISDMKSHQRRYNNEPAMNFGFLLPESSYIELRRIKEITGKSMASIGVELLQPEIKSMLASLEGE